jgi:hypothetical protein
MGNVLEKWWEGFFLVKQGDKWEECWWCLAQWTWNQVLDFCFFFICLKHA